MEMENQMEKKILKMYQAHGYPLARYCPFAGAWESVSRFGYAIARHKTRKDARAYTMQYYIERPNLV